MANIPNVVYYSDMANCSNPDFGNHYFNKIRYQSLNMFAKPSFRTVFNTVLPAESVQYLGIKDASGTDLLERNSFAIDGDMQLGTVMSVITANVALLVSVISDTFNPHVAPNNIFGFSFSDMALERVHLYYSIPSSLRPKFNKGAKFEREMLKYMLINRYGKSESIADSLSKWANQLLDHKIDIFREDVLVFDHYKYNRDILDQDWTEGMTLNDRCDIILQMRTDFYNDLPFIFPEIFNDVSQISDLITDDTGNNITGVILDGQLQFHNPKSLDALTSELALQEQQVKQSSLSLIFILILISLLWKKYKQRS